MVDCTALYKNLGCKSGWPSGAFLYMRGYGISSEADYPWKGK